MDAEGRISTTHGLAFLALLSFIAAFLAARTFATLNPDVVVVAGGIHLHHFWYGLTMIVVAGWLGIAHDHPRSAASTLSYSGLAAGWWATRWACC